MKRAALLGLALSAAVLLAGTPSKAGLSNSPVHVYFTDGEDGYPGLRVPETATLRSAMGGAARRADGE